MDVAKTADTAQNAGIPKAEFVDDVDEYMSRQGNDSVESVLKKLEEKHQKYKFMEFNLGTKKSRLKQQLPDIKSSLDIVKHLQTKKDSTDAVKTHYQLSDNLYVKATIPPTDKVSLWLGANVMLEYTMDDAEALLTKNHVAAEKSLAEVESDIDYIKDQTTTIEVNMARVYNWDVNKRKGKKEQS